MKNLNHTLQLDAFYKYGIGLCIAILCLFHVWLFLGLTLYMYVLRKQIHVLFFCFLFLLIFLPYQYINQPINLKINDTFRVVDIDHYESYQRVTIKEGFRKYHIYVYDDLYHIGDELYISGNLSLYKEKTSAFGFDQKNYFLGHGIYGKINPDQIEYVSSHFHINQIREKLMLTSKDSTYAYVHAFIFGESIRDEHIKSVYENFNIIYLFTISGMHIYVLLMLLKKIMFHLNFKENYQQIMIICLLLFLCILNQFHYAVLRVVLIYILRIINKKLKLSFQHLDLICIAFYMMLLINIHFMYHQGFLITFIILIAIELLHPLYQSFGFYLKQLILTTLISMILIPFLSEIHILQILCLPIVIALVVYIIYPFAILAYISDHFFFVFQKIMMIFEKIIAFLSLKQISFHIPKFNIYVILIYYGLLIWICFGNNKIQIFKRFFYATMMMTVLLTYQIRSHQEQIVFLDVGQGDTSIIQTDSCHMVIDSYYGSLAYLKNHGVYQLDYLILTHSDEDHILEAVDIIKTIDVKNVLISKYDKNYPDFKQKTLKVEAYDTFQCGNMNLRILGPLKAYEKDNNNSVVLKFNYDNKDFLFTGDIETEAELDLIRAHKELLRSEIIKVPHHGSITSSSAEFLAYVNPSYAVISLKTPNSYGFPSDDVLASYMNKKVVIYRTDRQGTIIYHGKKRKEKWSVYLSI